MKIKQTSALKFFLFGQMLSLVGSKVSHFAIGFWLYERTHSVSSYALVLFLSFVPNIIGSFFAGPIVDRYSFKLTFGGGDFVAGITTLATALALFYHDSLGSSALFIIYGMIFLNSIVSSLHWVALNSFLPSQFQGEQLVRYNGYLSTATSFASLLAPAIAGFLGKMISVQAILIIDGITYLASGAVVALLLTVPPALAKGSRITLLSDLKSGLIYIKQTPEVLAIVALFFVFNLFSGLNASITPPLYLERYTNEGSGMILTFMGAGSLLIGFVQGVKPQWIKYVPNLSGPMILISLVNIAIGYFTSFYVTLSFSLLLGGLISVTNSKASLLMQEKIEGTFRGRVFATARGVSWICLPASQLIASAVGGATLMNAFGVESKPKYLGLILITANLIALIAVILTTKSFKTKHEDIK